MNKLFLAAGTAALAISAPAFARPDGGGERERGGNARAAQVDRGQARAAQRESRVESRGNARQQVRQQQQPRREMRAQRVEQRQAQPQRAQRVEQRQVQQQRAQRVERQNDRVQRAQQVRQERVREVRNNPVREARNDRVQQIREARRDNIRVANRDQFRNNALAERRASIRDARLDQRIDRIEERHQRALQSGLIRVANNGDYRWGNVGRRGLINGCPPGLALKGNGCLPPGQAKKMIGTVIPSALASMAVPVSIRSLYPDTSDYYYRYNNGYLYQVDRSSNIIDSLFPLLAGGYLPGQYLPAGYNNWSMPSYYNGFYPASYGGTCTEYAYGVMYYTDCNTGMIQDVMPLYANGYGVGQMLPANYGYYNVPMDYRNYYYDTANTGYWYAPGAIYQYDPQTQLITSIAALLSPGMSIGQPMPTGYGVYNVPMDYRARYYDTPDNWYRYANGNIYRVDPTTQLVTALVANILT